MVKQVDHKIQSGSQIPGVLEGVTENPAGKNLTPSKMAGKFLNGGGFASTEAQSPVSQEGKENTSSNNVRHHIHSDICLFAPSP